MLSHSNEVTDQQVKRAKDILWSPSRFTDGGSSLLAAEELEPLQGGSSALARTEGRTRAALREVGFSGQEVDGCSVRGRSGFPRIAGPQVLSSGWCTTGSRRFLDCQTPRRNWHGVDVKQPLSTALTMRIWCCTPSGMMN